MSAAVPFGTVMVDFDGETVMSLGIDKNGYVYGVVLVEPRDPIWDRGDVKPVPADIIGEPSLSGTRYAVVEDTRP